VALPLWDEILVQKLVACLQACLLCYFTYVTTCMLVWSKVVCDCFFWKTLIYNRIDLITKFFKTLICFLNLFVSDTPCLCGVEWMQCLWLVYACILIVCFYFFSAIESNDECAEEGGIFEYQEEGDQGQAIKASHLLDAYLNPITTLWIALLLFLLLCIVFVYCYVPYIAIVGDLAPQVELLTSLKMTPLTPTQYPEK
jgi:hypothetical protein